MIIDYISAKIFSLIELLIFIFIIIIKFYLHKAIEGQINSYNKSTFNFSHL